MKAATKDAATQYPVAREEMCPRQRELSTRPLRRWGQSNSIPNMTALLKLLEGLTPTMIYAMDCAWKLAHLNATIIIPVLCRHRDRATLPSLPTNMRLSKPATRLDCSGSLATMTHPIPHYRP